LKSNDTKIIAGLERVQLVTHHCPADGTVADMMLQPVTWKLHVSKEAAWKGRNILARNQQQTVCIIRVYIVNYIHAYINYCKYGFRNELVKSRSSSAHFFT